MKIKDSRKIINLCNSKIGFEGNIGKRTGYILKKLEDIDLKSYSISRSIFDKKTRNAYTYGVFKDIPSLLNAFRIKIYQDFNHKYFDIKIFEFFVFFYLKFISINKNTIVHLWDSSPIIIKYLKNKNCKVILDVPIAPHKYRCTIKDALLSKFSDEQNIEIIKNEQFCFDNSDIIIAPSIFVKDEILKYGISPKKIKTISFGVSADNYKKESIKSKHGIDFCLAGHLNNRKGLQYLLEAWEKGPFENDRLHLCGKLTPGVKKTIHLMKNKENIILPGFINTDEYFKKCDVYVFPSLMEGSSKSIYEAMNRSMPIICTAESGSIIKNEVEGFIIDKMNSEDILEKMMLFKNNKTLIETMGEKAKANVAHFSWDCYADNLVNVYLNN